MANNRNFDVSFPKTQLLQRVYSNYHALTFFFHYSHVGAAAAESLNAGQCIQDFHTAPEGHAQHNLFHFNTQDHDQVHAHLIKGKQFFEDISLTEMECLLKNLKAFEKKANVKPDARLSSDNFTELLNQYEKHLKEKTPEPNVAIQHALIERVRYSFKSFMIAFAHTFAFTLIDRYLVPFIISKTHSRKTALTFAFFAKGAVNALLASSAQAAGLNAVIEKVLDTFLHYTNLNKSYEKIKNAYLHSSAVLLYGSSYRDLLQALMAGGGTISAVAIAHDVISNLPKFTMENSELPQPSAVVNNNPLPPGLTHRRK